MLICAKAQAAVETIYKLLLCPSCCSAPLQWPFLPLLGDWPLVDCCEKEESLDLSLRANKAKVLCKQISSVADFYRQESEVKNPCSHTRISYSEISYPQNSLGCCLVLTGVNSGSQSFLCQAPQRPQGLVCYSFGARLVGGLWKMKELELHEGAGVLVHRQLWRWEPDAWVSSENM